MKTNPEPLCGKAPEPAAARSDPHMPAAASAARNPLMPECLLIPENATVPEPLVSVVISAGNAGKCIRACLAGLARQTIFSRCEIILVDSGSPENERAVAAEFQRQFPNLHYVRTGQETPGAAWNRGLTLARGRYWASVNTDDSLRDDALEILVAALDKHADCALAYADTAWTTKSNDTFPSANIVRTVKYPDYAPLETLFYSLAGCVQFFRTECLRQLGGFDASLRHAGAYEATLKVMAARGNAVHIPEVLSLSFQSPAGLMQTADSAAIEQDQVLGRYRASLDLANIFQVESGQPHSSATALAMLGVRASQFTVPWQSQPAGHPDFAFACLQAAMELDPDNHPAGMNLIALHYKLQRLDQNEAELVARWPKMREWIAEFRLGERAQLPVMKHAVLGPVYRPGEWSNRPTAAQLAQEPKALRPWIARIEGRHVYLSEDIFPRSAGLCYQPPELQAGARQLKTLMGELPPFYAHFGGAGDALLLLASFYDQSPGGIIFSHPNGVGSARALFDAFPKLSKIYFLPQHPEPFFHIILRYLVYESRNCLGAGTTPKDNYFEEWKAGLDIGKKYRINKVPRWAAAWRQNEGSRRVAVAPKGSLTGMVGSKRNLILPEIWPQVIAHILERGFEPVILGVPAEAKDYPVLPGCADARGESFPGQMKLIGRCVGLVGADSWAKTFSALAEIPTLVFEPIKGADIVAWKDSSDWVFIEPWPSIKMIRSLAAFRCAFDSRIAKIPGAEPQSHSRPAMAWEGSFLDYGSLSHINRELTARLSTTLDLTCVGRDVLSGRATADPDMQRFAGKLAAKAPAVTAVTVRHQWPPNWSRPESGSLVVIQPWEYGALPKAWVDAAKNVDEFWVPSPLVRHMYLDSGIAPEKVRVVPNGVDTKKFRPGVRPLALKTRKKFKFLFVGGTIFRKGPDILLEAYAKAFTAADDVCLVIKDFGGDSFYQGQTAEAAIRALQQNPSAPEILYLKDNLSSEAMPSLYAACNCLVLPYRGEGFGMPVLEAMACGRPVIVTAGGATDSFVSPEAGWKIPSHGIRLSDCVGEIKLVKNGWLLEPSQPHLGLLMKSAASDPAECRQRGAAGRAIAEKLFDWNDIAAAVEHRLKELAERAPVKARSGSADPAQRDQDVPPRALITKTAPVVRTKITLPPCALAGHLAQARELVRQKKFRAAWEAALSALAKRPFHPEACLLLAEIAQIVGDGQTAKLCAEHACRVAPGWKPAKKFLNQRLKGGAKPEWLKLPDTLNAQRSTLNPKLSVCLIVKNEEKFLGQCLKSVRDLASQIVVVDTGSTDRTIEIAKEHGAEVHSFAWCDDFSAARNAALEHATGDWVLMLDADEELSVDGREKLKSATNDPAVMAWRLPIMDVGREGDGCSYVPRFYRNAPGLFYIGRVHEQVFSSLEVRRAEWGLENLIGDATLIHHGYTAELTRDRNKVERNLRLLERAIQELPDEPHLLMNLGLELARSGREAEALERYREAFKILSSKPAREIVPELRETLLMQLCARLTAAKRFDEVVSTLASPLAGMNGGLTASLHFSLGLSHLELRQFSEAADQMRQCLAKRSQRSLAPISKEINTAAPHHCLAASLVELGDVAAAGKAFEDGLKGTGHGDAFKLDYARFLAGQNRPVDALHLLHEVVAENKLHIAAWQLGGHIALGRPEFLEFARDWTGEAMRHAPEDLLIPAQRAEALMLSEDMAGAIELWEQVWTQAPRPAVLAALILCEMMESPTTHAPQEGPGEAAASRAFIGWYQKLLSVKAHKTIGRLNEQIDKLSRALPGAARMLETAMAEASLAGATGA